MILDWDHIVKRTTEVAKNMGDEYHERIVYEHKEIIKQGANEYWVELLKSKQKFEHNDNGLVLPFILKMTPIDPVHGIKKGYVNGDDTKIDGVEITLEDGTIINTSGDTLINTNRGLIKVKDLTEDDEVY